MIFIILTFTMSRWLIGASPLMCEGTPGRSSNMTSQDIITNLNFLQWQELYEEEKPFQIFIDIPEEAEDQRSTNLVFEKVRLKIHDVRSHWQNYSLDTNGFMYRQHTTKVTDFSNRQTIAEKYLPEMEALLQQEVEGADYIFTFDWRVCWNPPVFASHLV